MQPLLSSDSRNVTLKETHAFTCPYKRNEQINSGRNRVIIESSRLLSWSTRHATFLRSRFERSGEKTNDIQSWTFHRWQPWWNAPRTSLPLESQKTISKGHWTFILFQLLSRTATGLLCFIFQPEVVRFEKVKNSGGRKIVGDEKMNFPFFFFLITKTMASSFRSKI